MMNRTFILTLFTKIVIFIAICVILSPGMICATEAQSGRKVALVMKALSNPFFSKMEEGAQQFARDNNILLDVFGVERETDIDRQIGIVEDLISRGYGAIVIAPADSRKLLPVCRKAMEKGIVIINIDNPFHKDTMSRLSISITFVGSDNRAGAGMVGNYVKRKLLGKGKVIVIEGIRGVENAELRKAGFIEAATEKSAIEIVAAESANWHTDEAFSLAVRLLNEHRDVDAIFCANDAMAMGVIKALDIVDTEKTVLVAGYDNIEAARNEMRNGRMAATIEQHPELMGAYGVNLAWNALNGKTIPDYVPTPLDLITWEAFGKKIGISISTLDNPFFASLSRSLVDALTLLGAEPVVSEAGNDDAQQLSHIIKMLNDGISILIVNPTHAATIVPGIELANGKKVPVITVDRKVSEGKIACHIESDNEKGGIIAAKTLARLLKGKGKVIEIEGIPGTSAAQERGAGFNRFMKTQPGIVVVARETAGFNRAKTRQVMARLLEKDVDFDGVFAHNDSMILGVLDAVHSAGYGKPIVCVGFDAIKEAVAAVQNGKLDATIAQRPEEMGYRAAETAVRLLRGESIPSRILVDLKVVEK
ncbi:MAG TPA: substrate-binding domain-containing protein [Desulfobacteraceae bacterium]|nr:substrate-binding domain-containing protein [Desulfobacteraceae bacterium]